MVRERALPDETVKGEKAMDRSDETDPWIRSLWVRTPPPSLKDNTADVDRLIKGIERSSAAER